MFTTNYEIPNGKADELIELMVRYDNVYSELTEALGQFNLINTHTLKPEGFYAGVSFDGGGFAAVRDLLDKVMKEIKEYITSFDTINKEVADMDSIGTLGFNDVSTLCDVAAAVLAGSSMDKSIKFIEENGVLGDIIDTEGESEAVSDIEVGDKAFHSDITGEVADTIANGDKFELVEDIEVNFGDVKSTVKAGNYTVDGVMYDTNGKVESVRVDCGDLKIVERYDSNGGLIKIDSIRKEEGVFTIPDGSYEASDMYGNSLGKFSKGEYLVYDVMYDSKGNQIGYKLTPDGEKEKWFYPSTSGVEV